MRSISGVLRRPGFTPVVSCCGVLFVAALMIPAVPAPAEVSWQVDGSIGYLFVSEAQGTPWFEDTTLPAFSVGFGGGCWLVGASADYCRRTTSFEGSVPGRTLNETVDHQVRNSSFRAFAKYYPTGREKRVAPYLGVGLGPGITSVEYSGAISGQSVSDRQFRLSYAGTLGAMLNLESLPVHAFMDVSYGGLGEVSGAAEDSMVPAEELTFVSVAVGVGASF
ncbi:MAG: outer membrane beta-barrel protein [Candidatus Eisenbacteria bacterium]|nr:outer membrane beta-barrel protein [Candidatus Eisenbacteria bacterium]